MSPDRGLAQDGSLTFATVDRPPFSENVSDGHAGFSIDLMRAIADDLGYRVAFQTAGSFGEMLDRVSAAEVDGAIANISVTSAREEQMDFSQPIFASGIRIMIPAAGGEAPFLRAVFSRNVLFAVLIAVAGLFGVGMLMWVFERRAQPYFDRPAKDAVFPSFWWALNLIVNGGFEERMPQTRPGRFFAVLMVIASLFLVSIFVASITASVTVNALQANVTSINDLDGRRVGTVTGSTAAEFLVLRQIGFRGFEDPGEMLAAFEDDALDAVVFDGPILAYYVLTDGASTARLLEARYRPENYGIALPSGSVMREAINQSLLRLREDGTYDEIHSRWFGAGFNQ